MRLLLWILVLALISGTATAGAPQRPKDCPQKFLALWIYNRQAAFADLPKRRCLLYGEHDMYVCDQAGCTAYFGQ